MKKRAFLPLLLNPQHWWLPLTIIVVVSLAGVVMIGVHTYTEAPPIPTYVSEDGAEVISHDEILRGQLVFQKYGLMDYGTMFGDGALRGADFTAEALHSVAMSMMKMQPPEVVRAEIKRNRYDVATNTVRLSSAQVYAARELATHVAFPSLTTSMSDNEKHDIAAFFFWGAWVCGVDRPGETYSYTHNWPYDPEAGNTPTSAVVIWTFIGSLALILGLGAVLYYHGKLDKLEDAAFTANARPFMTASDVATYTPHALQRKTYKFFVVAILLFGVQVLSGILTVHDFVGFVHFFGIDLSQTLPITITRSWHIQLSVLWISACWIGGSLFVMPMIQPDQSRAQHMRVQTLFWITVVMVAGMMVGVFMGPHGLLGTMWYWLGHQGWEFVELGKIWQILLAIILILWALTLYKGLRPAISLKQPWALPNWMVYATTSIVILLMSGFVAQPTTNFVIADFWRWCVIHMWAEAFFEVFTTVLIGYFMVLMGLVSVKATLRVVYLATLLFLGSGLLGISHNFYWNAKPVATMALGSVFSTLQVIPLVLLTLEAWRFSKLPRVMATEHRENTGQHAEFGFHDVFLFLLGVNFWNFFGAGVMGFIINLPLANYYEHGTYLTVNHGHAALMGVYGNLAIAAVVFCSKLLVRSDSWTPRMMRTIFWSINIGLFLMVILDLFPVGIWQLATVVERGLWYARSAAFVESTGFHSFTWMRIIGGSIFTLGGVVPLVWIYLRARQR